MARASDIRRILVALDASNNGNATLEAAIRLAALLRAEVEGVFVEDIDLLNLAGLEWTRQINVSTGRAEPLDISAMEAAIRAQAAALRRALEMAAVRSRVPWSFRILRGRVAQELLTAANTADLLVIDALQHALGPAARTGATAQAAAERAPRSVLLLHGEIDLSRPIFATFDGGAESRRALEIAADLAELGATRLTVLTMTDDNTVADRLEGEAAAVLKDRRLTVAYRQVPDATVMALCRMVSAGDGGVLVIGAGSPLIAGAERRRLLESVRCPVLLVR
jgi:nucleotide-binding universal stress UspA family protein